MEKLSKTRRKAIALSAQDVGERLVKLTEEELARIPLPDQVSDAIRGAKKITKHGGLHRQMQYIGALMRKIDVRPIEEALKDLEEGNRRLVEFHKQVEKWRDGLIRGNESVIGEIVSVLPGMDREHLDDLVAAARAELAKQHSSPAPGRALFRYLINLRRPAG